MSRVVLAIVMALLASIPSPSAGQQIPCATTASLQSPDVSFILPAPYDRMPQVPGTFWHGTQALWTRLPIGGGWGGLYRPESRDYRNKVIVWRPGYIARVEPTPGLSVAARRLDGDAPPATFDRPSNASAPDIGTAIMTAVNLPSEGCWELTLRYAADELTFVVSVP